MPEDAMDTEPEYVFDEVRLEKILDGAKLSRRRKFFPLDHPVLTAVATIPVSHSPEKWVRQCNYTRSCKLA